MLTWHFTAEPDRYELFFDGTVYGIYERSHNCYTITQNTYMMNDKSHIPEEPWDTHLSRLQQDFEADLLERYTLTEILGHYGELWWE